jgi:hypothetical protein
MQFVEYIGTGIDRYIADSAETCTNQSTYVSEEHQLVFACVQVEIQFESTRPVRGTHVVQFGHRMCYQGLEYTIKD